MRSISTYIYFISMIAVVSSNLSISTFCNKDSHVMKNARWSCRRRNRLPCSSCGETRKHCFWPRVSQGFIPEQGIVGTYWWQIFIWTQGDWDWTIWICFRCISFFLPKTSDLRLKFIEQAREQYGYLDTISKSVVYLINLQYDDMDTYTQFQNQQYIHIYIIFHCENSNFISQIFASKSGRKPGWPLPW